MPRQPTTDGKSKHWIGNAFLIVEKKARRLNSSLRSDDKRFSLTAHVVHQDGSTILMQNAFLMEASANDVQFVVLFSEHHVPQVFAQDDLEAWDQYRRVAKGVEFMR